MLFTCYSEVVALLPTAEEVASHYLYYWEAPALIGRSRQRLICTYGRSGFVKKRIERARRQQAASHHIPFFFKLPFLCLFKNMILYMCILILS